MVRFHVTVFNFERIQSFCSNFGKIHGFDRDVDRIHIYDCSHHAHEQRKIVAQFAADNGLEFGRHIVFHQRANWGIDQGGRLDYFRDILTGRVESPQFIWQFQEHYLDIDADWSRWATDTCNIDGRDVSCQIKADVIPDNCHIDLNESARVFEIHPQVGVIFACRSGIGIFRLPEDGSWFYADGANLALRGEDVHKRFSRFDLALLQSLYDGTYNWALFMEFEYCRRLSYGCAWYDLVDGIVIDNYQHLLGLECKTGKQLHQLAEPQYLPLYQKFLSRFKKRSKLGKKVLQIVRAFARRLLGRT